MPQAAQARAWWADVEEVRERIERKRERERAGWERTVPVRANSPHLVVARRGVREVRPGRHLTVVRAPAPASPSRLSSRHRPRMARRVGPNPDRVAAWAVVLGFALVLAAVLSAHG